MAVLIVILAVVLGIGGSSALKEEKLRESQKKEQVVKPVEKPNQDQTSDFVGLPK